MNPNYAATRSLPFVLRLYVGIKVHECSFLRWSRNGCFVILERSKLELQTLSNIFGHSDIEAFLLELQAHSFTLMPLNYLSAEEQQMVTEQHCLFFHHPGFTEHLSEYYQEWLQTGQVHIIPSAYRIEFESNGGMITINIMP